MAEMFVDTPGGIVVCSQCMKFPWIFFCTVSNFMLEFLYSGVRHRWVGVMAEVISGFMSGWVPSPRRTGRRRGCAIGDGTVAAASERNRVGQRYQEARVAEGKRKLVAETDRRRRGDGDTRRRPSRRRSTTRIPWPRQSP